MLRLYENVKELKLACLLKKKVKGPALWDCSPSEESMGKILRPIELNRAQKTAASMDGCLTYGKKHCKSGGMAGIFKTGAKITCYPYG